MEVGRFMIFLNVLHVNYLKFENIIEFQPIFDNFGSQFSVDFTNDFIGWI